jgi:hypothetical protein
VGQTVTSGIVSALGRNQLGINTFENFIQTDAAINPGNSGGALVDINGNLEGINTAIYSRSGGSMGIGFAIPVSIAKQVLGDIVKEGKVTRGWIGVEPNDLSPELAETFGVKANAASSSPVCCRPARRPRPASAGRRDHQRGRQEGGQRAGTADGVAGLKPGSESRFALQRGTDKMELTWSPDCGPRRRCAATDDPMRPAARPVGRVATAPGGEQLRRRRSALFRPAPC